MWDPGQNLEGPQYSLLEKNTKNWLLQHLSILDTLIAKIKCKIFSHTRTNVLNEPINILKQYMLIYINTTVMVRSYSLVATYKI